MFWNPNLWLSFVILGMSVFLSSHYGIAGQGELEVYRVWPNRIKLGESKQISLYGKSFSPNTKVWVGSSSCINVHYLNPGHLQCTAPSMDHTETADIRVQEAGRIQAVLPGGVRYILHAPPILEGVEPANISRFSEVPVTIWGHGFNSTAKVKVSGVDCQVLEQTDHSITFKTPKNLYVKTHDVSVLQKNCGRATLPASLTVFAPFSVNYGSQKVVTPFRPILLKIPGEGFDHSSKVWVGSEPCFVRRRTYHELQCVLPNGLPPGTYDLQITRRDQKVALVASGLVAHGREYLLNLRTPLTSRPGKVFRDYDGSEAEVLLKGFQIRRSLRNSAFSWLKTVDFRGRPLDITAVAIPPVENKGYWIDSSKGRGDQLIEAILDFIRKENILNHFLDSSQDEKRILKIDENLVLKLPQEIRDDFIAEMDSGNIQFANDLGISPYYEERQWKSEEEKDYYFYLRNFLEEQIQFLNQSDSNRYFVHPGHLSNLPGMRGFGVGVIRDVYLYNNPFDLWAMEKVLDSIRKNDEGEFLEAALNFLTSFPKHSIENKKGFLDSFSRLFVTKEFPSEGIRQSYYHFILRCGHLH